MASPSENITSRANRLLVGLVSLYIDSGIPVSSAALSDHLGTFGTQVPPSTVRLELSSLEREGFLIKPHRSSGRIPTSSAYRVYADSISPSPPDRNLVNKINEGIRALSGELRRLLDYAGEVLAEESGCLGFATSPSLSDARIKHIKLDPIEVDTILLRLELANGRNYHHLGRMPVPVNNFRLNALASLLTDRLASRRLADVSEAELAALVKHASEWGRGYDLFIHPLHDLITDARLGEGPIMVIHGAAGLIKASGDDPEALSRAVAFLDDRETIEKTLGAVPSREGARIVIGGDGASQDDNLGDVLHGLALVVAGYHVHSKSLGRLGVLGPLRMPYPHHLTLVNSVSELISSVLISRELIPGTI